MRLRSLQPHQLCQLLPFVAVLVTSCAFPRPSEGLLTKDAPWETLAPPTSFGLDRVTFTVRRSRLHNGLRLAVERAPTSGMVGAILTVGAGASNDPPGKEGLAHYVEHLSFRSPSQGGSNAFLALQRLGASGLNGSTDTDLTKFFAYVRAEKLPELLAVFAGFLAHPLADVNETTASIERDVLHAEERERDETGVQGFLRGQLNQVLFPANHPYSRALGGTYQSIRSLTLTDAKEFASTHYRPANATLYLVGEFPEGPAAVMPMLPQAWTGSDEAAVEPKKMPFTPFGVEPPEVGKDGPVVIKASVPRPGYLIAWRLPSVYGSLGGHVRIATSALGLRSIERALDAFAETLSPRCSAEHWRQASLLSCLVFVRDVKHRPELAKWSTATAKDIWQLKDLSFVATQYRPYDGVLAHNFSDAELTFAVRMRLAMSAIFFVENYVERTSEASSFFHLVDPARYGAMLSNIVNMPDAELTEFVATNLAPERARVVFFDPHDQSPSAQVAGQLRPPPTSLDANAAERLRDVPPLAVLPEEFRDVRQFQLNNGLHVFIARKTGFPTLTAALGFGGGWAAGDPPGSVEFIRAIQDAMGPSFYPKSLPAHRYGLLMDSVDGADATVDYVRAASGHLANALYMLADRLATIDAIDWRRLFELMDKDRDNQESRAWEGHRASPTAVARAKEGLGAHVKARNMLRKSLYGETAYAQKVGVDQVLALSSDNVPYHLAAMHNPKNAVLVIVGDVVVKDAESLVRKWFEPWQRSRRTLSPPPKPAAPPTSPPRQEIFLSPLEDSAHVDLTWACRLPDADEQARTAHRVLAAILGRKLYERLREQTAMVYGASATSNTMRDGTSAMVAEFQVDNAYAALAFKSLKGLQHDLATKGFDNASISAARLQLAASENLNYNTSAGSALQILTAALRDAPFDITVRESQRLQKVAAADVASAFATCQASSVVTLVGQEKVINLAVH